MDGPVTDLLFVRHAHAGNAMGWDSPDDLRPLTAKGLRQATRLGNLLAAADVHPDVLLSSARLRAVQTAEVLSAALGCAVQLDARLADGLSLENLRQIIEETSGAGQLLLVGHDPDFSDLVSDLVGAPIAVRKGALVRVEVEAGGVAPGAGILRWLIPPEALGR